MTRFIAPPPVLLYKRPRFPADAATDVWTEMRLSLEVQAQCVVADEAVPSMWRMVPPDAPPTVWASIFGRAVPLPSPAWAPEQDWLTAWQESGDASAMCAAVEPFIAPVRLVEAMASMAALAVPWVAPGETRFARALVMVREWARGSASPEAFREAHRAVTHVVGADRMESCAFAVAHAVLSAAAAADRGAPVNARTVPHALAMAVDTDPDRMQRDCAELLRAHIHVRDVYNAFYERLARVHAPARGDA